MPRKSRLSQEDTRKHVWRHNSFFGFARMMHSQCEIIAHAESTTRETQETARRIQNEIHQLIRQLKERVDK